MTNCNCECHDGAQYASYPRGPCQACWDTHQVADLQRRLADSQEIGRLTQKLAEQNCAKAQDLQRRLREAEKDVVVARGHACILQAERDEAQQERDAARAAVRLLAGALKSALDEYVPKSDGKRWPGPRLSILNDRLRYEAALADPVVQAVLEGKADG